MLLKKVFNALNSLTMCFSGSRFSNPRLTSYKTLILKNHSVWMRKGSYGWAFALLVLDLILSIFVGPSMHWMSYLHAFFASYIYLYALCLFWSYFYFLVLCEKKIQNQIKSEKFKKFDRICLSTSHMSLDLYLCAYGFVHLRA